jgi:hypothetical protein
MKITELTSKDLKKIQTLIEKKELLQSQIESIDQHLNSFAPGSSPKPSAKPKRRSAVKSTKTKRRRGAVTETIVKALKTAGKTGISAKELVAKTGIKTSSINSWIHITGKKSKLVKRVTKGKYAYTG